VLRDWIAAFIYLTCNCENRCEEDQNGPFVLKNCDHASHKYIKLKKFVASYHTEKLERVAGGSIYEEAGGAVD